MGGWEPNDMLAGGIECLSSGFDDFSAESAVCRISLSLAVMMLGAGGYDWI
jgi:hypothetical protein